MRNLIHTVIVSCAAFCNLKLVEGFASGRREPCPLSKDAPGVAISGDVVYMLGDRHQNIPFSRRTTSGDFLTLALILPRATFISPSPSPTFAIPSSQ
jgi:hypothetical protein